MTPVATPIPAATLIVVADRPRQPPLLLMVERSARMAFAPGAMVFPGGRIDPGDVALAAALHLGDDGAARVAAIRETIEEAGVAVGVHPAPSPATIAALRTTLHAGTPFGTALDAIGAALDTAALTAFARWCPAHVDRVFDTHFFLAACPAGAPPASVDATENSRLSWTSAAAVLADADAGRAAVIYPTRRVLERLARFGDLATARVDARLYPATIITPVIERRDGDDWLCIPEGLGYPITAERMSRVRRG